MSSSDSSLVPFSFEGRQVRVITDAVVPACSRTGRSTGLSNPFAFRVHG